MPREHTRVEVKDRYEEIYSDLKICSIRVGKRKTKGEAKSGTTGSGRNKGSTKSGTTGSGRDKSQTESGAAGPFGTAGIGKRESKGEAKSDQAG